MHPSQQREVNASGQVKNLKYKNGNTICSTFCHTCQYDYTGNHLHSKIHNKNTDIMMKCGIGFTSRIILLPVSKLLMPEGSVFYNGNQELRQDEMVYRYYSTGKPLTDDDTELREIKEERMKNGAISSYIITARTGIGMGLELAGFISAYYNGKDNTMEPVLLLRGKYQSQGYGSEAALVLGRFMGILPHDSKDEYSVMFFRNCNEPKAGKSAGNGHVDMSYYYRVRDTKSSEFRTVETSKVYSELCKLWNHVQIPTKKQCTLEKFQTHFVSMADGCYRSELHSKYVTNTLSKVKFYATYHEDNICCEKFIEKIIAPKRNPNIQYTERATIKYTQANGITFEMGRSIIECPMEFIICKGRRRSPNTQQKRKREQNLTNSNEQDAISFDFESATKDLLDE